MCDKVVCDKVVCYKVVCVCVTKLCVKWRTRRRRRNRPGGADPKTRTPHNFVGN